MDDSDSRDRENAGEATRVDLGDDLVEKTALLSSADRDSELDSPLDTPFDTEDQYESARILMSEGLLEEAKKVLRRILIRDSGHVPSRQRLDEIHELELKQMFGDGASRRSWGQSEDGAERVQSSAEEVMLSLERDLQLGVIEEIGVGSSLEEQFGEFGRAVDRALAGATAQDRIDCGIAFLEMGLYGLASRQFETARQDPEFIGAATSLHAYAMILAGRPFEALMALESALVEPELKEDQRVELVYLAARAQEGLKRPDLAMICYQTVEGLQPGYRDVQDRLRKLGRREP